jgi:zinc/manganese transport system permease protein
MNLAALDPSLLGWPLAAGLAVLATHVPLGRRVLARGIVFLDLAIAQIAVLGVVAAHAAGWEAAWQTQAAAVVAALAGAAGLAYCESRWPEIQEALIGSSFVLAASAATVLVAADPHGGEHMEALLSGQILWARADEVATLLAISFFLISVMAWAREGLVGLPFYAVFAVAITASVQLVGVYLVFASLILPALAVRHLRGEAAIGVGLALGALGYLVGLAVSALWDWPSGPAVVLALAGVALVGGRWVARQRKGMAGA